MGLELGLSSGFSLGRLLKTARDELNTERLAAGLVLVLDQLT